MGCEIVKNNAVRWSRRRRVMRTLERIERLFTLVAAKNEYYHFTEQESNKLAKIANILDGIIEYSRLSEELLTPEISFQFTLED